MKSITLPSPEILILRRVKNEMDETDTKAMLKAHGELAKLIFAYPKECEAKTLLLNALGECPERSLVAYMRGAQLCREYNVAMQPGVLNLLKNRRGKPIFATEVEDLRCTGPAVANIEDGVRAGRAQITRRGFISGLVATAGFTGLHIERIITGDKPVGELATDPVHIAGFAASMAAFAGGIISFNDVFERTSAYRSIEMLQDALNMGMSQPHQPSASGKTWGR